jgi:parallel beta-helix repeat protein
MGNKDDKLFVKDIEEILSIQLINGYIEPPKEEWNKTFGGDDWEWGYSVQQTTDGGYIIVGNNYDGDDNVWLIKTSKNGEEQWNKTYGGKSYSYWGYSVKQTNDRGYIVVGDKLSYDDNIDVWLIKTSKNGEEQWNKTFGGALKEWGRSVQQTTDGGYIITGGIYSYTNTYDVLLIKTDANGDEQWNMTFGGIPYDSGRSVQQTTDGGYIITGRTSSYGTDSIDVWLIKTSENGEEQWNNTFGANSVESGIDRGNSVQQTTDGGYIIVGDTLNYGAGFYDVWLIKTDANGNEQWNKTFGGTKLDRGNSVQQTTDGGYILVGDTISYGTYSSDCDVWLIKTSKNGEEQWNITFGGNDLDSGNEVQQTTDGGYIIAGGTRCYIDNSDVLLIKIASTENRTIYVDDDNTDGPWDGTIEHPYQYIQEGIYNASDKDTVFVYNGTYYEHLVINKSINLVGESKHSTIIDANGYFDVIFTYKNFVNISGFSITNSEEDNYHYGIGIYGSFNRIFNNKIYMNNFVGIIVFSNYNNISGNYIFDNKHNGIYLDGSDYNIISDNKLHNQYVGIELGISSHNIIYDNYFYNHLTAIVLRFSASNEFNNNTLVNNHNGFQLSYHSRHNLLYSNQIIGNINTSYGYIGIELNDCYNNTIRKNKITDYKFGVFLKDSDVNKVEKNTFLDNIVCARFIDCDNFWSENYWERKRFLPKPIFGINTIYNIIPRFFEFDWHPAQEPYDI